MSRGRAARVLRMAIWGVAISVLSVALLVNAGTHWPWLGERQRPLLRSLRDLMGFPALARTRHARCSLADVWHNLAWTYSREGEALQRKSRLVEERDGFALWETPRGRYWIPRRDSDFFASLVEVDTNVYGLPVVAPRGGDVVLDCGSNVGVTVRWELMRGAKLVVAIEPGPAPIECLRRNLASEIAQRRVIVYPKGVWDRDARLRLTERETMSSEGASVFSHRDGSGVEVPLTTIDKIVAELGLERVDFIKLDVEGAEAEALRGAAATVAKFHPRMAIAVEHRVSDPDRLSALVPRLWPGYTTVCGPCINFSDQIQPEVIFASAKQ